MGGLIMKDFYNFRQYGRQFLLIAAYFCVFAFFMKSPMYMIFMGTVGGMICMFSSLGMDEAGGYAFAVTLPLRRKQIIGVKYLVCILEIIMSTVISSAFAGVIAMWHKIGYMEWIVMSLIAIGIFVIVASVIIPVFIKLKTEKAGNVFMGLSIVLAIVLYYLMSKLGSDNFKSLLASSYNINFVIAGLGIFVTVSVVCMIISFHVSVRFFESREF